MKAKILTSLLTISIVAALLISCAGSTPPPTSTTGDIIASDTSDKGVADEYIYASLDCNGEDFTFLNVTTTWDFYTAITHESETGEVLDDAIFSRNKKIEERYNVNIKEIAFDIGEVENNLRKTIQAGDAIYDAAFCPMYNNAPIGGLITQNLFLNLKDIPELQLDKQWWNQKISKDGVIGNNGGLYFALSDINIMNLQGAWCVYFNENMMINKGLELPYNAVKNGTWTFDEFYKYEKAGASLNGTDSYKWDPNGAAVFGYTSYEGGTSALMAASGESYIRIDDTGTPKLAIEHERFYDVCAKIAGLTMNTGEYQNANDYTTGFHFEMIFRDARAMMLIGELKAADVFRTMDDTFGIVPMPKFDENQKEYYTSVARQAPVLVVPTTNTNLSRTGIILDDLAYSSYKDVTPIFWDVTVSQKRLRNEDSIEMLQIIKDSVQFDIGSAYGWTSAITIAIRDVLDKGKSDITSQIEKNRDKVAVNITKTLEEFAQ